MKRIAIYGKGGIGKSTITSNISACLGNSGYRILQVGCDPKHDSTFLLTSTVEKTLLDMFRTGTPISKSNVCTTGKYGVDCIELGGPEPGIGCAGRGIIKGISLVRETGILEEGAYDLVLYDILGDIVCGGFFEPLRNGISDEMYIVTSGEFNSLFAANNLCCGYVNNATQFRDVKLKGIIANLRDVENEEYIVRKFCETIGVPLIATVPRDKRIEICSFKNAPILSEFPKSDVADIFREISHKIVSNDTAANRVSPLSFDELRTLYTRWYNRV